MDDEIPVHHDPPPPTGPLSAIGWLAFAILLVVSPAITLAAWRWLL